VVDVDAAFGEQVLDVAIREAIAQIPAHRHTITSAGKRNPANADRGGDQGRVGAECFTRQACLDLRGRTQQSLLDESAGGTSIASYGFSFTAGSALRSELYLASPDAEANRRTFGPTVGVTSRLASDGDDVGGSVAGSPDRLTRSGG
jgi:hypothetical protein